MKKVLTISFLVCAMLLSGCEVSDSAQSSGQTRPAVARSGRSYFWDKDLRPTLAVPPRREAQPIEVQEVDAQLASQQEATGGLYIEPETPARRAEL